MKSLKRALFFFIILCLGGCAVQPTITNQYTLSTFSQKMWPHKPSPYTILVNAPDALSGYQTEQMLYVNKRYALAPFIHNAWTDTPAAMLLPLMTQSMTRSGYFHAVATSPNTEFSDYRLDTQVFELNQNFLTKPSILHFVVKVILIRVKDEKMVATKLFEYKIVCPMETPYGGVIAANQATDLFTQEVTQFTIQRIAAFNRRR